jgi:hypothetical protein
MSTRENPSTKYYEKNKDKIIQKVKESRKIVLPLSGKEFLLKADLKKYVNIVIRRYKDIIIDKNHPEYKFFVDLWNRHPDKSTHNVIPDFFQSMSEEKRRKTRKSRQYRGEDIRTYYKGFEEDDWEKFSLNQCISGRAKTANSKSSAALRLEIEPQIIEFRKNNLCKCMCCGEYSKFLDVDHVFPFKNLVEHWKPVKDTISWKEFHLINAELQLLCKPCHDKKTYSWESD